MKIYVPGLPVQYVDEAPPAPVEPVSDFPSIEDAIALANLRAGTEVLDFTRASNTPEAASPLIDNAVTPPVDSSANVSAFVENAATPPAPVAPVEPVPSATSVLQELRVDAIVADVTATAVKLDELLK